ncbi:hypothetical protein HK405_000536, partial [Cladochytrium tenue]
MCYIKAQSPEPFVAAQAAAAAAAAAASTAGAYAPNATKRTSFDAVPTLPHEAQLKLMQQQISMQQQMEMQLDVPTELPFEQQQKQFASGFAGQVPLLGDLADLTFEDWFNEGSNDIFNAAGVSGSSQFTAGSQSIAAGAAASLLNPAFLASTTALAASNVSDLDAMSMFSLSQLAGLASTTGAAATAQQQLVPNQPVDLTQIPAWIDSLAMSASDGFVAPTPVAPLPQSNFPN